MTNGDDVHEDADVERRAKGTPMPEDIRQWALAAYATHKQNALAFLAEAKGLGERLEKAMENAERQGALATAVLVMLGYSTTQARERVRKWREYVAKT